MKSIKIQVQATGDIIEFKREATQFKWYFITNSFDDSGIFVMGVQYLKNPKFLYQIKQFFEKIEYNPNLIKINRPFKSRFFKDNVDPITYQIFKEYQQKANLEEAQKFIIFVDYMGLQIVKHILYTAIGSQFYAGRTRKQLNDLIQRFKLPPLTQQQKRFIKQKHGDYVK